MAFDPSLLEPLETADSVQPTKVPGSGFDPALLEPIEDAPERTGGFDPSLLEPLDTPDTPHASASQSAGFNPALLEPLPQEEAPGVLQGLVNTARIAGKGVAQALDVAQLDAVAGSQPTIAQERQAFVRAMEDPRYQQALTESTRGGLPWEPADPAKAQRAEALLGQGAKLAEMRLPIEEGKRALAGDIAQREKEIRAIEVSPAMKAWNEAEGGWNAAAAFVRNPVEVTANIVTSGLVSSVPGMVLGAAGGLSAGPAGTAAGAGSGSFAVEYTHKILDALRESGVDIEDPDAVVGAFSNKARMDEIRGKALRRGVPIAALDAFSGGVAGKFLKGAQGMRTVAIGGAKETGAQAALGAGGELAGQVASGEKISGKAIFEEAVGELGPGASEVGVNVARAAREGGQTGAQVSGQSAEEFLDGGKKAIPGAAVPKQEVTASEVQGAVPNVQQAKLNEQGELRSPAQEETTPTDEEVIDAIAPDLSPAAVEHIRQMMQRERVARDPEALPFEKDGEIRIQFRRNVDGEQEYGNQAVIRPLTSQEDYENFIVPNIERIDPRMKQAPETLREFRKLRADMPYIALFKRGGEGEWIFQKAGLRSELMPSVAPGEPWQVVKDFDAPEARVIGNASDKIAEKPKDYQEPEPTERVVRAEDFLDGKVTLEGAPTVETDRPQAIEPFRPAESEAPAGTQSAVAQAEPMTERPTSTAGAGNLPQFQRGQEVISKNYGRGKVVAVMGPRVRVDFNGTKIGVAASDLTQAHPKALPSDVEEDNIPFSMSRGGQHAAKKLLASDVEQALAGVLDSWRSGPLVTIVQSAADLPSKYRAEVQSRGAEGQVEGFFDPRRRAVFLVADNLESAERARQVLFHEVVGHDGIRAVLGEEYQNFMEGVLAKYADSPILDNILEDYELDLFDVGDRLEAAGEIVARIAEGKIEDPTLWERIVAAVRQWMRQHGFAEEITDVDIKVAIAKSLRVVRGERRRETGVDRNQFSLKKRDALYDLYERAEEELQTRGAEAKRKGDQRTFEQLQQKANDAWKEYQEAKFGKDTPGMEEGWRKAEKLQQEIGEVVSEIASLQQAGKPREAKKLRGKLTELHDQIHELQQQAIPKPELADPDSGPLSFDEVSRRVVSATHRDGSDTRGILAWFRQVLRPFATSTPEIAVFGDEAKRAARFKEGERRLVKADAVAKTRAVEDVKHVLKPLDALGRDVVDPETIRSYEKVNARIEVLQKRLEKSGVGKEATGIEQELRRRRQQVEELEAKLSENPLFLFRSSVMWRDFLARSFMRDKRGEPLRLPGGLSPETVRRNIVATNRRIAASPHAEAIHESLRRHYALMERLQGELLDRGFWIPETLRNVTYFPHHTLQYWSGTLDRVRLSTEPDFRRYLIAPTGSEKLIQSDYYQSVLLHVADVHVHNARMDLVDKFWKPYDISVELQRRLEEEAEARGEIISPNAWKYEHNWPEGYELLRVGKILPLRFQDIIDMDTLGAALKQEFDRASILDELKALGIDKKQVADAVVNALNEGAETTQWLVPKEIAEAINGLAKREQEEAHPGPLAVLARETYLRGTRWWKMAVLFGPHTWVRFEANNVVTDIWKLLTIDRGVFAKMPQAYREITDAAKGKQVSARYKAAMERGVLQAMTAFDVEALAKQQPMQSFETNLERVSRWAMQGLKDLGSLGAGALISMTATGVPVPVPVARLLSRNTAISLPELSALRESVFRYSKFLRDLERLEAGHRPVVGGAPFDQVDQLQANEDKAALIANRFYGDYSDMSVAGRIIRKYLLPFYAWNETNFKFSANLARNAYYAFRSGRKAEGAMQTANFTAHGAAVILINLALVHTMLALWNNVIGKALGFWEDDDDEDIRKTLSQHDRRRPHLILGRDKNGETMVVHAPEALSDVFGFVGGPVFARLAAEWYGGKINFPQFVSEYTKEVVNDKVQSVNPMLKGLYIYSAEKDPFPDFFDQRKIAKQDLYWVLGQAVVDRTAANGLRVVLDKDYYSPQDMKQWLQQAVLQVRRRDPDSWAYYEVRDKAEDWLWKKYGEDGGGSRNNKAGQVVRNFRKAIFLGDMENAVRFYSRLVGEYGYTSERLRDSIDGLDPLAMLGSKERRAEFVASLNMEERKELRRAYVYYRRIAEMKQDARELFPKRQNDEWFVPNAGRLRESMAEAEGVPRAQEWAEAERLLRKSIE